MRPAIELVLRRQAEAIANITLRPAAQVTGIVPAADGAGFALSTARDARKSSTPIWWSTRPVAVRRL
jgi:hypothetical protein